MNHSTVASLLACLFTLATAPAPAAPAARPGAASDRPESSDARQPGANEAPAEAETADPPKPTDAPKPTAAGEDAGAGPAAKKPAAPAKPKASDNGLPTADDIQQSFDDGAYEQTLKLLSRVLPLKGKAAEPYDRSALLELKVETHLRLKAAAPAMQALEQAAEATSDPKEQARYRATAALIKRSKGLSYVPKQKKGKGPGAGSIDLVDPKQRKVALEAMWADELARVKPKAGSAARQKVLPPIAAAIKEVKAVADLELGATGTQDETNGMLSNLNDQGLKLISKTVDRMAKRVDSIDAAADEIVRTRILPARGGRGVSPTGRGGVNRNGRFVGDEIERRRGVRPEEIQELKEIVKTCPQLAKAAGELVELSGQDTDAAESIIDKATETAEKAEDVLADG